MHTKRRLVIALCMAWIFTVDASAQIIVQCWFQVEDSYMNDFLNDMGNLKYVMRKTPSSPPEILTCQVILGKSNCRVPSDFPASGVITVERIDAGIALALRVAPDSVPIKDGLVIFRYSPPTVGGSEKYARLFEKIGIEAAAEGRYEEVEAVLVALGDLSTSDTAAPNTTFYAIQSIYSNLPLQEESLKNSRDLALENMGVLSKELGDREKALHMMAFARQTTYDVGFSSANLSDEEMAKVEKLTGEVKEYVFGWNKKYNLLEVDKKFFATASFEDKSTGDLLTWGRAIDSIGSNLLVPDV